MRCASLSGTNFDQSDIFRTSRCHDRKRNQTPQSLERSRWLPLGDRKLVELVHGLRPSKSIDVDSA